MLQNSYFSVRFLVSVQPRTSPPKMQIFNNNKNIYEANHIAYFATRAASATRGPLGRSAASFVPNRCQVGLPYIFHLFKVFLRFCLRFCWQLAPEDTGCRVIRSNFELGMLRTLQEKRFSFFRGGQIPGNWQNCICRANRSRFLYSLRNVEEFLEF